jgi:hypothetical protein
MTLTFHYQVHYFLKAAQPAIKHKKTMKLFLCTLSVRQATVWPVVLTKRYRDLVCTGFENKPRPGI